MSLRTLQTCSISFFLSPWICTICCSFLYIFIFLNLHQSVFSSTNFAYYTLLTDAFLHGRTYIFPQGNTFDLSLFEGKWYLYWGASPVLFILPFFLIGHGFQSDIFYTLVAGILNIFVFTLVIKEFLTFTKLSLSPFLWWVILVSFAFASPNFTLSLGGRIWHTGQIISLLYLLIFLFFFFRFLNRKKVFLLLPMLFFFNLAWLGRLPLILYGVLFFYLLKKNCGIPKKYIVAIIFAGLFAGGLFFGWYNNERFKSPSETGAHFQQGHTRYQNDTISGTFLSSKNILHNARYYFIESPFSFPPPAISFNPEGTSIFFVYPVTLFFLFSLLKKGRSLIFQGLLLTIYVVLILLMLFLLLFIGTGWYQFGSRYFFDLIPLIFLCAVPAIQKSPRSLLYVFLYYEILISVFGAVLFYTPK